MLKMLTLRVGAFHYGQWDVRSHACNHVHECSTLDICLLWPLQNVKVPREGAWSVGCPGPGSIRLDRTSSPHHLSAFEGSGFP
jgi:hypothetical protein